MNKERKRNKLTMSVMSTESALGSKSAWPSATGKASRMASTVSVSKILLLGMSPSMIFLENGGRRVSEGGRDGRVGGVVSRVHMDVCVRLLPHHSTQSDSSRDKSGVSV